MLWGRFASRASEARYPQLWQGLSAAWCPTASGPTGLRLYDLTGYANAGTLTNLTPDNAWSRSGIAFSGLTNYIALPSGPSLQLGTSWSITSVVTITSFQNFAQIVVFGGNGITLYSNNLCILVNDNVVRGSSTTAFGNIRTTVTVTKEGTNYAVWLNGIDKTSTLSDTGYGLGSTYAFNVGYSNTKWTGTLHAAYVHKRKLSGGEIRLLATDNLAPIRSRNTVMFGTSGNRRRRILCGGNC